VFLKLATLAAVTLTAFIGFVPVPAKAQSAPAAKEREWKDRAEYDAYQAALTATDPKTKLEKVNEWKSKYPTTEFEKERREEYLKAYAGAGQAQEAVNVAKEILAKDDPKNFTALYYITFLTPNLPPAAITPDALDTAAKAANGVLSGLDAQFAADKKPAGIADDVWAKNKTATEVVAHTTLGWVAMQKKDAPTAIGEFQKSLTINPGNGAVNYWLFTTYGGQKGPENQSKALFYGARAASYDGEGALNPQGRTAVLDAVKKYYVAYHGSPEGFDQLVATAKTTPAPPPDFVVVDKKTIAIKHAQEDLDKEEKLKKENPQLALWISIRDALTAAEGGQAYFDEKMKGSELPEMKGKVVSIDPATKPTKVVIAIADGKTPDATLHFEKPLPGKVEPGTELTFAGVATAYTKDPFMVTFDVDPAKLKGWTGKNAAPARRAPVRRKR
jgi:hypothetical protein